MFLLSTNNLWVILAVVLGIIILCGIFIFIYKKFHTKKDDYVVDASYVAKIIASLGGLENIKNTFLDNRRLAIDVENVKSVDTQMLKEIAKAGVFITKNTIKVLFKYDSETLKKLIDKTIKESK